MNIIVDNNLHEKANIRNTKNRQRNVVETKNKIM